MAFSPDGKRVATGGGDGTVCLWDPLTGKELQRFKAHPRGVFRLVFTADGKRMLTSTVEDAETIREWDTATGRQLRSFGHVRKGWFPIALSRDGQLLASGELDGAIRLWDMGTGKVTRSWSAGPTALLDVAFSPDGKTLASAAFEDSGIRLWDVATGKERHASQEHHGSITNLRFAQDGKTLVSTGSDQRMLWWDLTKPLPARAFSWKAPGSGSRAALSADGNVLADVIEASREDAGARIQLWDVRTGKTGLQMGNTQKQIDRIAFSPNGRLLACGGKDAFITLWDALSGKEVRQLKGLPTSVRSLCFSPDGMTLAVGLSSDIRAPEARKLRLFDVATGGEKATFDVHDWISGVAFSPDGKVLAAGNGDQREAVVRLMDVKTGAELCRHEGHRGSCGVIAFSADGKLVASRSASGGGGDRSLHLWEAATGRLIRRFEGQGGDVISVAFAPDGLSLASGSSDSTILLWDITSRRPDGRWQGPPLTERSWKRAGRRWPMRTRPRPMPPFGPWPPPRSKRLAFCKSNCLPCRVPMPRSRPS